MPTKAKAGETRIIPVRARLAPRERQRERGAPAPGPATARGRDNRTLWLISRRGLLEETCQPGLSLLQRGVHVAVVHRRRERLEPRAAGLVEHLVIDQRRRRVPLGERLQ